MKEYKAFVCIFVVGGVGLICLLTNIFAVYFLNIDGDNIESQVGIISFVTILVIIPDIMLLWVFIAFAPQITFNEIGLEKCLCGIPLKKYKWEDIRDIKIITTGVGAQWLFFSKVDLKNHGIDYCRLHPKTIYIAIDDKKLQKIKEFIPHDKVIREHRSKWLQ